MKIPFLILTLLVFALISSCDNKINDENKEDATQFANTELIQSTAIVVLGNIQDAGYPQIGCTKSCCVNQWSGTVSKKMITCLGLIDPASKKSWMFEATPDFKYQTKRLSDYAGNATFQLPNGIFLTHAHIGHYVGLMHLGREAMSATQVPVYALPRMSSYLEQNGPWSQLVALNNIDIKRMTADSTMQLSSNIKVTPFLVPHRGEYAETAGFLIEGEKKKALFIPDIDKWHFWERDIKEEVSKVDIAFLDATFYKNGEVGNRDMSEIPHPFVEESMKLFDDLSDAEKSKIYFIHFNHTNPMLQKKSNARKEILEKGYHIAEQGFVFDM